MNLYPHQKEFLESENNNAILTWEAGTGKTFTAKLWLEQGDRNRNPVVFGPKQIEGDIREAMPKAFFSTPQRIYREALPENPSAIFVDEADMFASPLFVAKSRSKCSEAMYNYIMDNPDADVLLATATPVRSTPWNMHTLLVYARMVKGDSWKRYREKFFSLQHMPYLPRPAWLPIPTWRKDMQRLINKYTRITLMSELVDILPPETHEIIKLKTPNYEVNEEWEPATQNAADHRLEQDKKDKEITKISKGYRKVVVVVHFREQIDELHKKLSKERETFVLDGRTKDVHAVIKDAEASPECYIIIQASVGAGFDLHTFACMIFASRSYSVRNYVQMKARIRRISSLKPVIYYYLHAGRIDTAIYKNNEAGLDFVPSEYMK